MDRRMKLLRGKTRKEEEEEKRKIEEEKKLIEKERQEIECLRTVTHEEQMPEDMPKIYKIKKSKIFISLKCILENDHLYQIKKKPDDSLFNMSELLPSLLCDIPEDISEQSKELDKITKVVPSKDFRRLIIQKESYKEWRDLDFNIVDTKKIERENKNMRERKSKPPNKNSNRELRKIRKNLKLKGFVSKM